MNVFGTKTKKIGLGRVADFCPICREPRPFRLLRIGEAFHFYYMSFGAAGSLQGYQIKCESCKLTLEADRADYKSASRSATADMEELVNTTHPDLRQEFADRLAVEETIRRGQCSGEIRLALIREPFLLLESELEVRASDVHVDAWSLGAMFATILVAGLVGSQYERVVENPGPYDAVTAIFIVLGLGALTTLILFAFDVRRYIKRRIIPLLIRSLRPLSPTLVELADTLDHLKSAGLRIGKKIHYATLHAACLSCPEASG